MSAVTHPRFAPRRSPRSAPWWSKAWARAVEESAYHLTDLRAGRALARSGRVGALTVDRGSLFAAVQQGDDAWTVSVAVPTLSSEGTATLVELVAAESGRIAHLLDGDLPHQLVEDAEDAGVELLPYGSELAAECSCQAWAQPCTHALAVLTQFTWVIDEDPLALLHLRGVAREELLAGLHDLSGVADMASSSDAVAADVEIGVDAARRAARLLDLMDRGEDPGDLL